MTWVVAGLGNPGEPYARTRHNLGAMVVGELASREGLRFRRVRFLPVDVAEIKVDGERLLLARSHRFMNDSGPSYASLAKKNGVDRDRVIAVHDELDLPFGALKLKLGGSTAGHNGLSDRNASARHARPYCSTFPRSFRPSPHDGGHPSGDGGLQENACSNRLSIR